MEQAQKAQRSELLHQQEARRRVLKQISVRLQNQRRVVVPGPRGRILDRDGNVLVDNRARFSVVLNLAELRGEREPALTLFGA